MANTMTHITTTTVSTAAYSVTMASIPQTYTDLMIAVSARSDYGFVSHEMQFAINSVTSGYSNKMMYTNNGTSVASASASNAFFTLGGAVAGSASAANTFSNCVAYLPSYSSTTLAKSVSVDATAENNGTAAILWINSGLNTTTAAITSITFYCWQSFINFVPGSTFSLYGIKNS
jgi:hypothetical protein